MKELIKKILREDNGFSNKDIEDLVKSQIVDVTVPYVDFDGNHKKGVIQINQRIANRIKSVFEDLYKREFPIQNIEPANGRSDRELIDNNITTSYNFRRAITPTGEGRLSKHAWGLSFDINPKVNPAEPDCGMNFEYDCEQGVLGQDEIDLIKSHGFQWGGEIFKGFWDSHHFEVPFTKYEVKLQNAYKI